MASSSLKAGDTISGVYDWTVKTTGNCAKVEYWATPSGKSPIKLGEVAGTSGTYVFHFDTTSLPNGDYLFGVVENAPDGTRYKDDNRVTASVYNGGASGASGASVASSIQDGTTLSGKVPWTVDTGGVAVSKVEFYVDGSLKWTENLAPYVFNGDGNTLDTTTLSDGSHVFSVKATTSAGGVLGASAAATVANTTTTTPPPPPPPPLGAARGQLEHLGRPGPRRQGQLDGEHHGLGLESRVLRRRVDELDGEPGAVRLQRRRQPVRHDDDPQRQARALGQGLRHGRIDCDRQCDRQVQELIQN